MAVEVNFVLGIACTPPMASRIHSGVLLDMQLSELQTFDDFIVSLIVMVYSISLVAWGSGLAHNRSALWQRPIAG